MQQTGTDHVVPKFDRVPVILRTHCLPILWACDFRRWHELQCARPHPPELAVGNNTSTIFLRIDGKVLQQLTAYTDLLSPLPAIACPCLLHSPRSGFQPAAIKTAGFLLPGVNAALHVDMGRIYLHDSVTKSMPKSWGARRQGKPASMPIAGFFFGAPESQGDAQPALPCSGPTCPALPCSTRYLEYRMC
jgi:hypothetical protein